MKASSCIASDRQAGKPGVPGIAPGVRVRITLGMASGVEGVVLQRFGCLFGRGKGAVEQWLVQSDDLVRQRVMRADHLEVLT